MSLSDYKIKERLNTRMHGKTTPLDKRMCIYTRVIIEMHWQTRLNQLPNTIYLHFSKLSTNSHSSDYPRNPPMMKMHARRNGIEKKQGDSENASSKIRYQDGPHGSSLSSPRRPHYTQDGESALPISYTRECGCFNTRRSWRDLPVP